MSRKQTSSSNVMCQSNDLCNSTSRECAITQIGVEWRREAPMDWLLINVLIEAVLAVLSAVL